MSQNESLDCLAALGAEVQRLKDKREEFKKRLTTWLSFADTAKDRAINAGRAEDVNFFGGQRWILERIIEAAERDL